jgi:hypothetical protein
MKKKLLLCVLALAAAAVALGEKKVEAITCPPDYTLCCVNGVYGCFPTFRCFKGCTPG